MRRLIAIIAILALTTPAVFTVSTMPGCASVESTPRGQYFETQEAYIFAVAIALDRKRAGQIDQDDWNRIYNPAIQEGNLLLDAMESASITGDFDGIELARSVLVRLTVVIRGGE